MLEALRVYFEPNVAKVIWGAMNIIFAMMAGSLGYLSRSCSPESATSFSGKRFLIETGNSGFVGFLALLICVIGQFSEPVTGLVVGFLGWIGATKAMDIIGQVVVRTLETIKHVKTTGSDSK